MGDAVPLNRADADREKRLVALSSVLAAIALVTFKLVVGLTTGSLGILSEAAHSGLDLLAAGVTFWAVRVSSKPADRDHPFGHGKFENLSALFETLLLLVTCLWIIYESVRRLFFHEVHVEASAWGFVIMAASIVIDFSRSRALARVAKKYDSQALEADALHFSTDIWSSAVVLVGLGAVYLSDKLGLPWLQKADIFAALGVAGIVVWVSIQLGRKSLDDLLDATPPELHEKVVKACLRVSGVLDVQMVRVRKSGPEVFAEVTLTISRHSAFEQAHQLAHAAEAEILKDIPGTDVMMHVEPVDAGDEGLLATVRLVAARSGLGAHAVHIYEQEGAKAVQLHLEVPDTLNLHRAHQLATSFEQALHQAVPTLGQVVTHLDPAGDTTAIQQSHPDDEAPIREAIDQLRKENALAKTAHDLTVQRVAGELSVSFHCDMDGETSIVRAHELSDQLEKKLRAKLPQLGRVVIHVEPSEPGAAASMA